jgi:glycerol-3-phosphate acyltransferase PlsY
MNTILLTVIFIILNYLAGSISSAILISRYIKKVDIRNVGYKTAGGSNVATHIGIKWGMVVGIFDFLKGVPFLLLGKHLGINGTGLNLIGIAAVIGHCWPIWFQFSGGRGIATLMGIILFRSPALALYPIILFILTLPFWAIKKYTRFHFLIFSSPFITFVALLTFLLLSFLKGTMSDRFLAILLFLIIIIRRITARFKEYSTHNPLKLFLSRFFFDDNNAL